MKKMFLSCSIVLASFMSVSSHAGIVSHFNSDWTDITVSPSSGPANEDQINNFSRVFPGYGGQEFDAEYIFYRLDGNMLSVGIQTGFDIVDGHQRYNGRDYYAGDLALSFDSAVLGNSSTYEYAIDFGLLTKGYSNTAINIGTNSSGIDAAGLYAVSQWNNDIYFSSTAPFAMDEGSNTGQSVNFMSGSEVVNGQLSYFQTASFDVSQLLAGSDVFELDAHWTMSCGNDAVDGHVVAEVPEPAALWMIMPGLLGLMGSVAVRRRKITC